MAPAVAGLALVTVGCGRLSPDDAAGEPQASLDAGEISEPANKSINRTANSDGEAELVAPISEPGRAGVRVVSDSAILTPLPPTTSTTAPPPQSQTYEVQPGDTLSVIAERFGITITALADANGIDDVNSIKPGQELIVPAASP